MFEYQAHDSLLLLLYALAIISIPLSAHPSLYPRRLLFHNDHTTTRASRLSGVRCRWKTTMRPSC